MTANSSLLAAPTNDAQPDDTKAEPQTKPAIKAVVLDSATDESSIESPAEPSTAAAEQGEIDPSDQQHWEADRLSTGL